MRRVLQHLHQLDNVGVALAAPQELDLPGAVDAPGDDLDGALLAGLAVDAAAAHRVAAVAQDALAHVQVVVQEERRFLKKKSKYFW